jgi:4-amino-4-deoxy-L-arabinose transferase-like glycosyltransferase
MKEKDLHNNPYRLGTHIDFIVIIIFFLLLIASFNEGMGNDEGMWNYIGRLWVNGIPPYTGAVDGKPPGIFMLFAISNFLFGVNFWFPRILGILAMVITSMLIYLIGRRLYNPLCGTLAMIIFGLTMAWELMDGAYAAQIESFMILFVVLAFFSLIKPQTTKESRSYLISIFTSGFFMGLAIAFKQIAIFSAVALILFFFNLNNRFNRNIWRDLLILFAGTMFSIYISLVPLLLSGVTIADYWREAWLILVQEGSRQGAMNTSIGSRIANFFHTWRHSEMLLFYPLILLFIIQRKRIIDNNIPFFVLFFVLF